MKTPLFTLILSLHIIQKNLCVYELRPLVTCVSPRLGGGCCEDHGGGEDPLHGEVLAGAGAGGDCGLGSTSTSFQQLTLNLSSCGPHHAAAAGRGAPGTSMQSQDSLTPPPPTAKHLLTSTGDHDQ